MECMLSIAPLPGSGVEAASRDDTGLLRSPLSHPLGTPACLGSGGGGATHGQGSTPIHFSA
jgi:hypothetical protein